MANAARTRKRTYYPSQLKLFRDCHRRYFLKVIERMNVEEEFSPPLEKGKVAHDILKICVSELMRKEPRLPADIRGLVEQGLAREQYASDVAWHSDITEIDSWVKYALSYIDPDAAVLGVEMFLTREYRGDETYGGFTVGAVLDLLLLRIDINGNPYLEVVDWKSGRGGRMDPLAPVISRFVLKPFVNRYLPGDQFRRVVYTTVYLAERHPKHLELNLDHCEERWEEIKSLVAEIEAEERWQPSPSPLCQFCPFNGNGCPAGFIPESNDKEMW